MAMLRIKVQVMCGDAVAMGPGKADLLDQIRIAGSISAAARAMDMSYRRAWQLVDVMNRCWSEPLVATSPGSARGGAQVTQFGETVLERYRALQQALARRAEADPGPSLHALLREAPLAHQAERPAPRETAG